MLPELVILVDAIRAARDLKINLEELELLVTAGDLPAIFIHGKRRFLLQDVEALIRSRRT